MSRFEQLRGRISGQGDNIVVLSHGLGTDQSAWTAVRPWLEQRFRVISFDLAGCGPDGAAAYDFGRHASIYGYADDLLDLFDDLAIDRCIYVGHSMSAMIGIAAANLRPGLIERLVLLEASPRYLNDGAYVGGFERADLDALFDSMAANFQAWVAGFAPAVVGIDDSQAIEEFARTLFQMRPDIALATTRAIFLSDVRALVPHVAIPTHIVQTAIDMAVPREVGIWLNDHIRGSTLDLIDGAGHLPHVTTPAEVLRVLDRHLPSGSPSR